MEKKFLTALLNDRDSYESIKSFVDKEDLSDVGQVVFDHLSSYYTRDVQAQFVDLDLLASYAEREAPSHATAIERFVSNIEDVSVPNIMEEYIEVRLASLSRQLSVSLANGKLTPKAQELMQQIEELDQKRELADSGQENTVSTGLSVASVMDEYDEASLIQVYPPELNEKIGGGAIPGTHIVVAARPETGKTMFCVNMLCGFLRTGRKALYIGNEDPAAAIKMRIMNNLLGWERARVMQHPERADRELSRYGGNLVYADLHPGSVSDVRRLVAEHRPDVVLVDQMRNLRTAQSFSRVEGLENIARELRNIAKEFGCVMVSVTQAGDSAEGNLVLGMGDIDSSKTGIPAAADILIGIGTNQAMNANNRRMISLPKNKLSGNHDHFQVEVVPSLSQVK